MDSFRISVINSVINELEKTIKSLKREKSKILCNNQDRGFVSGLELEKESMFG